MITRSVLDMFPFPCCWRFAFGLVSETHLEAVFARIAIWERAEPGGEVLEPK